jgi:tetratricopeptide (TPR) repeat protein
MTDASEPKQTTDQNTKSTLNYRCEHVTPDERDKEISFLEANVKTRPISLKESLLVSPCAEDDRVQTFVLKPRASIDKLQSTYSEALEARSQGTYTDENKIFSDASRIGRDLQRSGRFEQALEYYGQALRFKNKSIVTEPGSIKSDVADILYNIGVIHMFSKFDDRDKCVEAFQMCLELRRYCYGSIHPSVASVLYKLASIHFSQGEKVYALDLLIEVLSILQSTGGHPKELVEIWYTVSRVQEALGQFEEAESSYNEASSLLKV